MASSFWLESRRCFMSARMRLVAAGIDLLGVGEALETGEGVDLVDSLDEVGGVDVEAAPELDRFAPGIGILAEAGDEAGWGRFEGVGGEVFLEGEVGELVAFSAVDGEEQTASLDDLVEQGRGGFGGVEVEGGEDLDDGFEHGLDAHAAAIGVLLVGGVLEEEGEVAEDELLGGELKGVGFGLPLVEEEIGGFAVEGGAGVGQDDGGGIGVEPGDDGHHERIAGESHDGGSLEEGAHELLDGLSVDAHIGRPGAEEAADLLVGEALNFEGLIDDFA